MNGSAMMRFDPLCTSALHVERGRVSCRTPCHLTCLILSLLPHTRMCTLLQRITLHSNAHTYIYSRSNSSSSSSSSRYLFLVFSSSHLERSPLWILSAIHQTVVHVVDAVVVVVLARKAGGCSHG